MIIDKKNKEIIVQYNSNLINKIAAIILIFLLGVICGYTWAWNIFLKPI